MNEKILGVMRKDATQSREGQWESGKLRTTSLIGTGYLDSRHSSVLTRYSTGTNIWFKLLLFYAGFFLLLQYLILGILYLKYFNLNNSTIQIFQFYSDDSVFIKWKVSYKSGVNIPSHLLTRADRLVTSRNIFNLIGETTLSPDHQLQLQHQIQNHRPSQHLEIFHLKRFLDETRNSIEWF